MGFRIAVITDIHHGTGQEGKRGGCALRALDAFAEWVNREAPDLVLDLGDRIADQSFDVDKRLEAEVAGAFEQIKAPMVHINGNHDRDHLSVSDNERILGQALDHEVRDVGDWRLILWRAETVFAHGEGLSLTDRDVAWLETVLAEADRPVLLASHVPPFAQDMTSNHYFQENAEIATYRDISRIDDVLGASTCPLVTLSGHVHWTTSQQRGGIWHLTQQALTEIYPTGSPAMAWGMMELGEDVAWTVEGSDPISLRFRPGPGRWAKPLPRFSDMPATGIATG